MSKDYLADAKVPIEGQGLPDVKTFLDLDQMQADVKIDPNNIENGMLSVAAIYNRYAHIVAMARIQRDGFKSRKRLLEAKVEKKIRADAIDKGEKLTNPQIQAMVNGHPVVVAADLALNEAMAVLTACQEALSAVSMKRDMLVQLNKNQNREWEMTSSRVKGKDDDLSDVGL